jgi:sedoheptulose-bisphosphatase
MSHFVDYSHSLPSQVLDLLSNTSLQEDNLPRLLESVLRACRIISENLRSCHYSTDIIGTVNDFGDEQLDVDVKSDKIIFECLNDSGMVFMASSEEMPTEIRCGGVGYSVAFDPLDGSSIVDANFAVGTIVGIWPGDGLLNRTGREQACSLVAMYGPRVTVALAFNRSVTKNSEPISMELTMHQSSWSLSVPKFTIASKGKTFAPGNLRATSDNPGYRSLVNYWIDNRYTLRYSGGMVPDVYHILIKGQGVMSNASSHSSAKAKLRLLYECAPIALIVEAAGGASCVCMNEEEVLAAADQRPVGHEALSLLDVVITDLDRRVGVCYGSAEEVERFKSYVF